MLPSHIKTALKDLSQSFDVQNRTWRGRSGDFNLFTNVVNSADFRIYKDDIKKSLCRRLRKLFTTAQMQTSPAPNIGQYVANAIRNIIRRY